MSIMKKLTMLGAMEAARAETVKSARVMDVKSAVVYVGYEAGDGVIIERGKVILATGCASRMFYTCINRPLSRVYISLR